MTFSEECILHRLCRIVAAGQQVACDTGKSMRADSLLWQRKREVEPMVEIKAFCAVRPRQDLAEKIAALPYDVYSRGEAAEEVKKNPFSFLKIDRPEVQFDENTDMYSPAVYQAAGNELREMIGRGEFIQEKSPCLYLYELTMDGRTQTGVCCCASVADYENGVIKRHENTRPEKEEDRIRHVEACGAQTGPIFLACRKNQKLTELEEREKKAVPIYSFTAEDGIRHQVWKIENEETIRSICEIFEAMDSLYIADGHHRAASAVRVARKRREKEVPEGQRLEEKPEAEAFLSVIFPENELKVLDYNRWVKDLNGYSRKEFLNHVGEKFRMTPLPSAVHPKEKGRFSMYLDGQWYELEEKTEKNRTDAVESLDVSILQNEILSPVLGIKNPKTDKRIQFIGGIRGLSELERLVDAQGGAAFALYPTSMEELFRAADQGRLMPPKSTWFEPKLRSGLFLHMIS